MSRIWMTAKCQDFINKGTDNDKIDSTAYDDFFYLADYKGKDVRHYPAACAIAGEWTTRMADATNASNIYKKEVYNAYSGYFTSTTCGDAAPIATGVMVHRNKTTPYKEVICVVPGCAQTTGGTCTNSP